MSETSESGSVRGEWGLPPGRSLRVCLGEGSRDTKLTPRPPAEVRETVMGWWSWVSPQSDEETSVSSDATGSRPRWASYPTP